MPKALRPVSAVQASSDGTAQQFYLVGAATPAQTGIAGSIAANAAGPSSLAPVAPAQDFQPAAGMAPAHGFVLDAIVPAGLEQPSGLAGPAAPVATIFPAEEPPVVADSQILLALKDGSMFLLDADMISGKTLELRDALANVGIVFADPAQGSDVLEEFGLSTLLGGWLADLQALSPSGGAGDLGGHNGIF